MQCLLQLYKKGPKKPSHPTLPSTKFKTKHNMAIFLRALNNNATRGGFPRTSCALYRPQHYFCISASTLLGAEREKPPPVDGKENEDRLAGIMLDQATTAAAIAAQQPQVNQTEQQSHENNMAKDAAEIATFGKVRVMPASSNKSRVFET